MDVSQSSVRNSDNQQNSTKVSPQRSHVSSMSSQNAPSTSSSVIEALVQRRQQLAAQAKERLKKQYEASGDPPGSSFSEQIYELERKENEAKNEKVEERNVASQRSLLLAELRDLQRKYDKLSREHDTSQIDNQQLSSEAGELRREVLTVKQRLETTKAENSMLRNERDTLFKRVEDLTKHTLSDSYVRATNAERSLVTSEVNRQEQAAQIESQLFEIKEQRSKIDSLVEDNTRLVKTMKQMERHVNALEAVVDGGREALQRSNSGVGNMSPKNKTFREIFLPDDTDSSARSVRDWEVENEGNWPLRVANLSKMLEKAESERDNAKDALAMTRKEVESLQASLDLLKEEKEKAWKAYQVMEDRVTVVNTEKYKQLKTVTEFAADDCAVVRNKCVTANAAILESRDLMVQMKTAIEKEKEDIRNTLDSIQEAARTSSTRRFPPFERINKSQVKILAREQAKKYILKSLTDILHNITLFELTNWLTSSSTTQGDNWVALALQIVLDQVHQMMGRAAEMSSDSKYDDIASGAHSEFALRFKGRVEEVLSRILALYSDDVEKSCPPHHVVLAARNCVNRALVAEDELDLGPKALARWIEAVCELWSVSTQTDYAEAAHNLEQGAVFNAVVGQLGEKSRCILQWVKLGEQGQSIMMGSIGESAPERVLRADSIRKSIIGSGSPRLTEFYHSRRFLSTPSRGLSFSILHSNGREDFIGLDFRQVRTWAHAINTLSSFNGNMEGPRPTTAQLLWWQALDMVIHANEEEKRKNATSTRPMAASLGVRSMATVQRLESLANAGTNANQLVGGNELQVKMYIDENFHDLRIQAVDTGYSHENLNRRARGFTALALVDIKHLEIGLLHRQKLKNPAAAAGNCLRIFTSKGSSPEKENGDFVHIVEFSSRTALIDWFLILQPFAPKESKAGAVTRTQCMKRSVYMSLRHAREGKGSAYRAFAYRLSIALGWRGGRHVDVSMTPFDSLRSDLMSSLKEGNLVRCCRFSSGGKKRRLEWIRLSRNSNVILCGQPAVMESQSTLAVASLEYAQRGICSNTLEIFHRKKPFENEIGLLHIKARDDELNLEFLDPMEAGKWEVAINKLAGYYPKPNGHQQTAGSDPPTPRIFPRQETLDSEGGHPPLHHLVSDTGLPPERTKPPSRLPYQPIEFV